MSAAASLPRLCDVAEARVADAVQGPGLLLDLGAATLRVQGTARSLPAQLQAVYAEYPLQLHEAWADVHVRLDAAGGLRRWWRPQVVFSSDGTGAFSPFPADSPLPLLEWGCNWVIGHRLHHRLLFHAAALERDGLALVLPAVPGSGKSTLAAGLACRGWRLLSDEFGVLDPTTGQMQAMLKPVALKNESIGVIRGFDSAARLGPLFPRTRKGTVAHLAPDAASVRRRHEPAQPGAVVLPRWQAGSPTVLTPLEPQDAFSSLAFNAFNYQLMAEAGFDATLAFARRCRTWRLVYSDLEDAARTLAQAWQEVAAMAAAEPA